MDQTDTRLADLESRVAVLEASSDTTTTSTASTTSTSATLATTTTSPATTTTTASSTTSTVSATTSTSEPEPSTSTTLPSPDLTLTADLHITEDTTLTGHIEGNGHQILIDGADVTMRDLTVNNVSRIMWHGACGVAHLDGVTVSNSGGPELGFYPIHFHLCGDTTRGSVVENTVVRDSAHHAFVPHGSHGITFRNTRAVNIAGAAYWWDPGRGENCSNDILYDGSVAENITNAPGDSRGFTLAAFRLGCGEGNIIRNSLAVNVSPSHPNSCSGFHWPENDEGVWLFENNRSVGSACNGIFVWQNTGLPHVVDGFTGDGIENGAYVNRYLFRNIDVDHIIAHNLGHSGFSPVYEEGRVGSVLIPRHTLPGAPIIFRNLAIGSFTIDNTHDGGTLPGTYILENTGLTCGDIDYQSVVPGTRVVVDGAVCR